MERANSYQSEDFIGCVMRGVLPSIRVCGVECGWVLMEKRKESFFSSGTSRPRVGFLARLEINPVGMNPFTMLPWTSLMI